MDKLLRAELVATVERTVKKAMEAYQERWLTADELHEYVSLFTRRWLQDHGHLLPRTPVEWTDQLGERHTSSYLYPLHRIQAMIADGRIKDLRG